MGSLRYKAWFRGGAVLAVWLPLVASLVGADGPRTLRVRLTVTTPLSLPNTPLAPTLDFPDLIRQAKAPGVLDPNSIEVRNTATGQTVAHNISEDFAYSDQGRIEFVVVDPRHTVYEIRFATVAERPPLRPRKITRQIGVGDLLRYNAGQPRPITVASSPGLHDLNGDGQLDLTGAWNYAYRPGWPWDGMICYPRTGKIAFQFGDLTRLRYAAQPTAAPRFFSHTYMAADFADFDRDGRLDLVITRSGANSATFYRNTGKRDPSGMPRFEPAGSVRVDAWQACRVLDLDRDGVLDLVVDGQFLRNTNPAGWPFRAASPMKLAAGRRPCFLDLDGDALLDSICLHGGKATQPNFYQVAWRKNLGGTPPKFAAEEVLREVDLPEVSLVAAWHDKNRSGLIVQHRAFQSLSFYQLDPPAANAARRKFRRVGEALSNSAVLSLSDQAWPRLCDWDNDGDQDLLVGGGYGWPRIVINDGSRGQPAFRQPMRIMSDGKPIRFLRNQILGAPANPHDMGYPYPDFIDWDADGLPDLVCPNETNRIFWYKNIGTRKQPKFGPRRQILCDGFPDSPQLRSQSNRRANDSKSNNGAYPLEPGQPFMWRTGAALADFNADGLTDMITHDGQTRVATLFVQYRDANGKLRLHKDRVLKLADGREISDAIVERSAHWTESFRAVDWNRDGLQDLIYSVSGAHHGTTDGGSIYLLRNVGSKTDPQFAAPETMRCFGQPIRITNHGPHPWPGDFDGDGKPDLITCVEWSVYPYYSHAALTMKQPPAYRVTLLE